VVSGSCRAELAKEAPEGPDVPLDESSVVVDPEDVHEFHRTSDLEIGGGYAKTGQRDPSPALRPWRSKVDQASLLSLAMGLVFTTRLGTPLSPRNDYRPDMEPPIGIEPMTYALRGPSEPHAASRDEFLTRRDALDGARHLWLVNSILRTPCGPVPVL
jgi:hypothetical protein